MRPTAIGGWISVADSDELALLSVDGLPIGTMIWNADVGSPFTLTLSDAALVTDSVVEVYGVSGSRWIVYAIANAVTADGPANAATFTAALNPATNLLPGLISADDRAAQPRARAIRLTDADVTISPNTDKCSAYILPAGTLTANRKLTIADSGGSQGLLVHIVVEDISAFTYTMVRTGDGALGIKPASPGQAKTYVYYWGGSSVWNSNTEWWSN